MENIEGGAPPTEVAEHEEQAVADGRAAAPASSAPGWPRS
jgi:hypothetical protein